MSDLTSFLLGLSWQSSILKTLCFHSGALVQSPSQELGSCRSHSQKENKINQWKSILKSLNNNAELIILGMTCCFPPFLWGNPFPSPVKNGSQESPHLWFCPTLHTD